MSMNGKYIRKIHSCAPPYPVDRVTAPGSIWQCLTCFRLHRLLSLGPAVWIEVSSTELTPDEVALVEDPVQEEATPAGPAVPIGWRRAYRGEDAFGRRWVLDQETETGRYVLAWVSDDGEALYRMNPEEALVVLALHLAHPPGL